MLHSLILFQIHNASEQTEQISLIREEPKRDEQAVDTKAADEFSRRETGLHHDDDVRRVRIPSGRPDVFVVQVRHISILCGIYNVNTYCFSFDNCLVCSFEN